MLVTNNASDFRRLYAAQSIHPGLVIILPSVGLPGQIRLFRRALDELSVVGEPINRVLEVNCDGDKIIINLYGLAADSWRKPFIPRGSGAVQWRAEANLRCVGNSAA